MKLLIFMILLNCGCYFSLDQQFDKVPIMNQNDSIKSVTIITSYFDTIWIPGDENKIISEINWYNGDSIKFQKFYPIIAKNDTVTYDFNCFNFSKFENLKSEMRGDLSSNNDVDFFIESEFDSNEKLIKETITYSEGKSSSNMLYYIEVVEYEYAGEFISRKLYYEFLSLKEKRLIEIDEFIYN